MERKQRTILCQSEHQGIPPRPKHTHIQKHFFIYRNSLYGPASWTHTQGDTSDMPSMKPTEHPRTSPPDRRGQNTYVCIHHAYVYRSVLSREQTRLALSTRDFFLLRLHSWGRRSDWAVSYCTDQLLTPNFSGGSTLNGTPCGDRWTRVLCGQIGWLSEALHRVDSDCSGCTIF